jgi:hypothetical protein
VYANVVSVSRGETVPLEVLGTGDAATANQSFTLKKGPLTYLSAPTGEDPSGVRNTLTVRVRDVRWAEVRSFYGVPGDAPVYIVRQDDAGGSTVIFGDGVRGARIPSGSSVVARYRFGAGAASPPAGGITQLAKPVKGVIAVKNPIPAAGGDAAQAAVAVRTHAPRSALLFGRAVSITDMEALAAGRPGVRSAQAQWSWNAQMQVPTVTVWFIGPANIAPAITTALRGATAPSTPITAVSAQAIAATLVVDVRVDSRHQVAVAAGQVRDRLTEPVHGLLSAERLGVGGALFSSVLLAEILEVQGISGVSGLIWQGAPFDAHAFQPGVGAWFDVTLTVNAMEDPHA